MAPFWKGRSASVDHITEQHLRAIVAGSPLPTGLVDGQGELLLANNAWWELLGGTTPGEGEPPGRPHPADADPFARHLTRILGGSAPQARFTCRWLTAGALTLQCDTVCYRPSNLAGGVPLALITLIDLTDRVALEQQYAALSLATGIEQAAAAVTTATTAAEEAWPEVLRIVAEGVQWDVAVLWQVDPSANVVYPACMHYGDSAEGSAFFMAARDLTLVPGSGVPGQTWQSAEAQWVSNLSQLQRSPHTARADQASLRSSAAVPIRFDGSVTGVLEVLSRDAQMRNETVLRALALVAGQIERMLVRLAAEFPLRAELAQYRITAESAGEGIITIDEESTIVFANRAAEELFQYPPGGLLGLPLTDLMPEALRGAHQQAIRRYCDTNERRLRWDGLEFPGRTREGKSVVLKVSLAEVGHSGRRLFSGFITDITEQKQQRSALIHQALHDALTELPNRSLLEDRLQRAILVSQRHGQCLSLLFMDLDRFKDVNDTFGHRAGDELLRQVAGRLKRALRESDTVARLGGDEFAVLLPSTDERGTLLTARRILHVLSAPFEIAGKSFEVGASLGITLFPQHGEDSATLMRKADMAMYAAKRAGSGYAVYTSERDELSSVRLLLANELRHAIESDQLVLHYQPKVDLATGQTEQVEALVRWAHPQRGLVPPDVFITVAEDSGLIRPLTIWVLNEALRQHRAWLDEGIDLRIAVNFSARTLHDHDLLAVVTELLRRWEVDASKLEIEITESAIMIDPERAKQTLKALHDTGIYTSIDDFGTGHSSLAYLRHLPFDQIKIDKSFVLDMATSRDDASIVRTIVALGHNFDLHVVAEGVDNQRTLDMLRAMHCDLAQGFFLSRPVPAADLAAWLRRGQQHLASAG